MKKIFFTVSIASILFSCHDTPEEVVEPDIAPVSSSVKNISYKIMGEFKHDTSSYTEGFELYKGKLYESGGDYINSRLQYGDLKTGKIEKQHMMGTAEIFGEGITILNGKLYQLTYTTHNVYVYDVNDITKVIANFQWPYEGWGMTNNGKDLIISTGGADVFFVDPQTFKIKGTVHVHDNTGPVDSINELEYVDGFIWANRFTTKDILKINAETGAIEGKMNFDNLPAPEDSSPRTEYFNGIAYDSTSKSFYITGKRWNKIYQVQLN